MAQKENEVSTFITRYIMNNLERSLANSITKIEECRSIEKDINGSKVFWNQVEKIDNSALLASSLSTASTDSHKILPGESMKFPYDMPTLFSDIVNARDKNDLVENNDGFKIEMDIKPFKTSEVSVEVKNDTLVISAVHEEKLGKSGMIRLKFLRKYSINNSIDKKSIRSSYNSIGNLIISGSKKK